MELPPLLILGSEEEYREHYVRTLVKGSLVITPDGAKVRFFEERFDHAFFRKTNRWKDEKDDFARSRAERMDWIRVCLTAQNVEIYREPCRLGQLNRLVVLRMQRYMVVTVTVREKEERFVTAYDDLSNEKIYKVTGLPRWK